MDNDLQAATSTPAAPPATASSGGSAEERPMFDKPNLQLSDPDPYAFANRIRKLVIIASVLAVIAAAPFFTRVFAYQVRLGQMQAEYETASEALGELAPQLKAFEEASRSIAKKVGPSVVSINTMNLTNRNQPFLKGVGSGFIVDPEGYIITNEHVVRSAERLLVRFSSGETADATLVGADRRSDLAVLKIDGGDLPALELSESSEVQMGDLVWAVGSPFGLDNSITFGIVSATSRRASSGVTDDIYQEFVQSDAAVNPGNSGGPMVNLAGDVVGVNTMILGKRFQGVSFSIPTDLAKQKYLQLREKGFVERGFLGVYPQEPTEQVRVRLGLERGEGVLISQLRPNTPASQAGLQNFDVILRWNDHRASDPTLLSRAIESTEIGSEAKVLLRRLEDGKPIDKELTVRVGRSVDGGR